MLRKLLSWWRWADTADVVVVHARGRMVYLVSVDDVYMLDDHSDLFSTPVLPQWVNTTTGEIVGYRKSRLLTRAMERAIANGTVKDATLDD